jgi:tetratricopeptide (TPR) repeat protein
MARIVAFLFAGLLSLGAAAAADTPPWVADQTLANDTYADFHASGIQAIANRRDALEAALARARASYEAAGSSRPTRFILTDGDGQAMLGMLVAGAVDKNGPAVKTVAVSNPYPKIGMILGSYYNEVHQPEDALRVLDAGIAADKLLIIPGDAAPILEGERALTLDKLKRFDDALAGIDDAVKQPGLAPPVKAHLLRIRGFTLTEMSRLDDAEKAYNDSLALEPGNPTALGELQYIAKLRGGAPAAPGALKPLDQPHN